MICSNCYHYIYKKCSQFKPNETTNMDWNWECHVCSQDKFPCVQEAYEEVIRISYNSNLNCLCTQHSINPPTDLNLLLKSYYDKDSSFVDEDPCDRYLSSNVNFKYYDIHDFQKLNASTLNPNKQECISHFLTIISSLQANIDNLEYLLHDLDFDFDIIALSETWNPERKHLFSPKIMKNYHPYKGTSVTTCKSGTGFYIHKDLNSVLRPDLEFKLFKEDEEFESYWIEIVNDQSLDIIIGSIYRHPSGNDKLFMKKNQKYFSYTT